MKVTIVKIGYHERGREMTKEEAKKIILKHQFAFASMPDEVIEAVSYLIEEQESVLDKIRAEIESITPKAHIRTGKLSIDTELMIPLDRVLQVIDKYKTDKEYEAKVITRGNCMMCGKELTEGLFFCKECESKAIQGRSEGK